MNEQLSEERQSFRNEQRAFMARTYVRIGRELCERPRPQMSPGLIFHISTSTTASASPHPQLMGKLYAGESKAIMSGMTEKLSDRIIRLVPPHPPRLDTDGEVIRIIESLPKPKKTNQNKIVSNPPIPSPGYRPG